MGPSNAGFFYPELNSIEPEIRLLTVSGWTTEGILSCSLQTCVLNAAPSYSALSYAWGHGNPTNTIQVNGQAFKVRKNLWEFLSGTAIETLQGTLWFVDAICINQGDLKEKSVQVSLMREIYMGACEVVAWLGPYQAPVEGPLWDRYYRPILQYLRDRMSENEAFSRMVVRNYATEDAEHIAAIFLSLRCTYWMRLWIVQELFLARSLTFQLGHYRFGLTQLHATILCFCSMYNKHLLTPQNQLKDILTVDIWIPFVEDFSQTMNHRMAAANISQRLFHKVDKKRVLLYELMLDWNSQQCQDPRDKVFGLLGMADSSIFVDYSISTSQLFLLVLIEGLIDISQTVGPESRLRMQSKFYRACMTAFKYPQTHATSYLLTRTAVECFGIPGSFSLTWIHAYAEYLKASQNWPLAVRWLIWLNHCGVRFTLPDSIGKEAQVWYQRTYSKVLFWIQERNLLRLQLSNSTMLMPDGHAFTYAAWIERIEQQLTFLKGSDARLAIWQNAHALINAQQCQKQMLQRRIVDICIEVLWASCFVLACCNFWIFIDFGIVLLPVIWFSIRKYIVRGGSRQRDGC